MTNDTTPPEKSSFLRREFSKEDAIIQFLRPQIGGRVSTTLDVFERLVNEAETLVKLGIMLQPGGNGKRFHITPDDLRASLDEFPELEQIATLGREFLDTVGYVTQRKRTPLPGAAPVGENVEVMPITSQLPGSEPLQGGIIRRKSKPKPQVVEPIPVANP